ncbi:MAG: sensor histidine kinase, partial [Myxococcota bacterium]
MAQSLAGAWPGTRSEGGLGARLKGVPEELWERRGVLLLVPTVLTAAYAVLLADLGIGLRQLVLVYAQVAFFTVCMVLGIVGANALVPRRLAALAERSRAVFIVIQGVVILAGVVVGAELGLALFQAAGIEAAPRPGRTALYGLGVVFGYLAEGIALLFDGLELRAARGELQAEQARREAAEARLAALQARTNPHFLFNSLNAIAGLVGVSAERAERAIETLSESMRYALESTRTSQVALAHELDAVRDHLHLEELRYGERLDARLDVEPGLETLAVPPLCLQPVVENAILHGIAQRERGGALRVSARREGGTLRLRVEDDGPGLEASGHAGTGTALADLRDRLELLYGDRASLSVGPGAERGCRVE